MSLRTVAGAALLLLAAGPLSAQSYRLQCETVYDTQPVTAYRLQYETVMEEQQVTSYRPVWETEARERRYTVAKPVYETSTREERYKVLKPVQETEYRQQTRYVNETQMREERYVVSKPVWVTQEREEQYTVRKQVVETAYQDQVYTAYDPVTTCQTQYVDQGGFVDQYSYTPGPVRNRLRRVPGSYYVDPTTGLTTWYRGGLHWVPEQQGGAYSVNRVYVPNVVAQQVPVTSYQARQVVQKVPVNVTRYVDEVEVRKVPVQVCQMVQEEQVRQVPVTVAKPVVEQIPVQVCRWVEEEVVRNIPVQTMRYEYEERVEPYQVQVQKVVAETRTVQVPRTEARWVQQTYYRHVPRTVVMRIPIDTCQSAPVTSYYAPSAPIITTPGTTVQRVETRLVPVTPVPQAQQTQKATTENGGQNPTPAVPPVPEPDNGNGENEGPMDSDPTGQPQLAPIPQLEESGVELEQPRNGTGPSA